VIRKSITTIVDERMLHTTERKEREKKSASEEEMNASDLMVFNISDREDGCANK
jgi:hypothetical protein